MLTRSNAKPALAIAALATILGASGYAAPARADDKALADQVKILMQKVEELS